MKNIAIIGSTGSIGKSALAVVRSHSREFCVKALAARQNVQELAAQAREFRPEVVCIYDASLAPALEKELKKEKIRVVAGEQGLLHVSGLASAELILFALVGAIGLRPIFEAVKKGKNVAVANKEPLVMAGQLLMNEAAARKVSVLPVDSEHSGMWQCLEGRKPGSLRKLILTSSGGPFRARKGALDKVTPAEALNHPRWKMGPKITIDSATLMNKGLEVIEAVNLFGMPAEKVGVLIHPEAIIHAIVEFVDGSQLAHMGITDMRLPIQYAFTYPERLDSLPSLDLASFGAFHFEKPDTQRFPCLELGYEAARRGGTLPAVLNAANEIAVDAFLNGKAGFMDIPAVIEKVMRSHRVSQKPSLEGLIQADEWAREEALKILNRSGKSGRAPRRAAARRTEKVL